jgi:arylesterase/paraoxonase
MKPLARAALTAGTIIVAAGMGIAARTLDAYGVFTSVPSKPLAQCTAITGIQGPEDIAIDFSSKLAFVSAFDRRAAAAHKWSSQDGIYATSLKSANVLTPDAKTGLLRVTFTLGKNADSRALTRLAGSPADFHPHGISLYRDANGLVLMAINHHADGTSSVESFDVKIADGKNGTIVSLSETGNIESRDLNSPNAIAAIDRARFYVVNDHGGTTKFGRMLDDLLVLPRANLLYYDGMVFRPMADRLAYPSGLAISPDGHHLYVTEANARRLDTFALNPESGQLTQEGTLDIPSNLDNVRFDDHGVLWLGSHPKNLAMAAYRSDPSKPAPSEIFKIATNAGIPQSADVVYAGTDIGGSSVAAVMGDRMLIGGPLADRILDCKID